MKPRRCLKFGQLPHRGRWSNPSPGVFDVRKILQWFFALHQPSTLYLRQRASKQQSGDGSTGFVKMLISGPYSFHSYARS